MITLVDLYLRLSDGRNENGSFTEREAKLRERADWLGWTVARVVVENDLMNGSKSASAFKRRKITLPDGSKVMRVWRPGFRTVLDDLASGRANAVLAEDLDRTMRDPRDAQDFIDVIRACSGNAESLSGSLKFTNGGTDSEIMMTEMLVSVARKSSADTARRVAAGRERQAGNARWGGGRRPYGFTPVANPSGNHRNTVLVVDPVEAAEIRKAADQILAGISLRSIALSLREREVPTVTGTRWTAETLKDILTRPLTAGIIQYQGKQTDVRLPGEPILTEDVWQAVVDKVNDPMVTWVDRQGITRSTERKPTNVGRAPTWLGTGIYRCVCGSVMEIQRGTNRAATYRCAKEGGTGDVHVRRNAAELDVFVAEHVIERLSRPDAVDLVTPVATPVDVKGLRTRAQALRERKRQLAAAFGAGDLDDVEYAAAKKANAAKLNKIEAELGTVTDTSPLAPLVGAEDVRAAWAALSLGQRRAVVSELLTVTVLPTVRSKGFRPEAVRVEQRTHTE